MLTAVGLPGEISEFRVDAGASVFGTPVGSSQVDGS